MMCRLNENGSERIKDIDGNMNVNSLYPFNILNLENNITDFFLWASAYRFWLGVAPFVLAQRGRSEIAKAISAC
jgi:hypothetical protein